MPNLTLLDVAKANGNDKVVGLIEENLTAAPEIRIFPARTVKGTSFTTLKRTDFPTTGFRAANEGIATGKSAYAKQICELFIFGGAINLDLAVAKAHEDGISAFEMMESSGVMRSALINLGKQIWYGTANDAKGFPGIKTLLPHTAALGFSTNVVDATGSTAATASSCYAVKFGNQDAHVVVGDNGNFELPPFADQQLTDAAGNPYAGRVSNLTAWTGLHVGNLNCVGRIYNLTADSGKGLTDALLSQLIEKFPVGFTPDAFFVSRRSRGQLQRSRTATIFSQVGVAPRGGNNANIAPLPTEYEGIPIIATDSILNTDAINS